MPPPHAESRSPPHQRTPFGFVKAVLDAYAKRGLSPLAALQSAQIAPESGGAWPDRVSALQFERLCATAMRELDDEAPGWFSRPLPWGSYGMLARALLRVSEMVCELPQLREMDINPLIVDEDGVVAVDARIVLDHAPHGSGGLGGTNPYAHLAILPYPARHEQVWPLRGGGQYTVRPIHPGDAQMLQTLVQSLSQQSRYFRFVSSMMELPPAMLSRFTLIDYDREMALVAVCKHRTAATDGSMVETERVVAVSRYVTNPDQSSCEFSLVVADDFAGKGIGSRMMESIMDVAREKGLAEIQGLVLVNNPNMLKLMRGLGFTVKPFPEDPDFRLVTHAL